MSLSVKDLRQIAVAVILTTLLSFTDGYAGDNRGLFKAIYESEQTFMPFVDDGRIVSIDKEIALSEGSIFIVRVHFGDDVVYSFWAMERDSSHAVVWPFGGVYWGYAGERYRELLQRDSLFSLIDRGEWWKNDTIWTLVSQDKVEGSIIESDISELPDTIRYEAPEESPETFSPVIASPPCSSGPPQEDWDLAMDALCERVGTGTFHYFTKDSADAEINLLQTCAKWYVAMISAHNDSLTLLATYVGYVEKKSVYYARILPPKILMGSEQESFSVLKDRDSLWSLVDGNTNWSDESYFKDLWSKSIWIEDTTTGTRFQSCSAIGLDMYKEEKEKAKGQGH